LAFTSLKLREAWNWGGLTAKQLAARTYEAIDQHETLNRAAIVAYYALLALVPLLGLVMVIALNSASGIANQLLVLSQQVMPETAYAVIEDQVRKIQAAPPVGVLSFSFVVLLWSASSLFFAIMDSTNAAYAVRDSRAWWKRRLQAIVLTLLESALLLGASISIIVWPHILAWIGLGSLAATIATFVQWVVVVIALLASFAVAYFFGPDVEQEWEWITPGSVFGVLVLIAASLGFRLYVQYGSSYSETYGAMAGVVVLLLWLFLAALALLVGVEINSVIEHAAPHGKSPGQKEAPPEPGDLGAYPSDGPETRDQRRSQHSRS
jgi:membrane protein